MDKTVIKVHHDSDGDIKCIYIDEDWYDENDVCSSFKSDLEDLDIYCDDEDRSGDGDDDDDDDDDEDRSGDGDDDDDDSDDSKSSSEDK